MKCFGFSYDHEGLSLELCEEVIQYRTARADGISVVGNIILKSTTHGNSHLGIWHRADVGTFDITRTKDWLRPEDVYTHIFFNIAEDRARIGRGRTVNARLFTEAEGDPRLESEPTEGIIVPPVGDGVDALRISHPVEEELGRRGLLLPPSAFRPYTYAEIGPFRGREQYYAIRVVAELGETTVRRLVTEVPCTGTRFYEVYGVNEISRKIERLDLPELERYCERSSAGEVYEEYYSRFVGGLQEKALVPEFYSIVAIDSPDSCRWSPDRMYTVQLRRGLKELTEQISEALFDHEGLTELKGRVFWFVNEKRSQEFRLQLEGPMAEVDLPDVGG